MPIVRVGMPSLDIRAGALPPPREVAMSGLVVLITNHTLAGRSGTEIVVRDLALGLQRRGHRPIVYTTQPGPIAEELLTRTVPVVTDLSRLATTPDVIHGHHTLETALAMLRFPGVPALFTCHDWSTWHDEAPRTPLIRQYLAVDETCRDRLVTREGIRADVVRILPNAVDLDRFTPRDPLPRTPSRALMFSNYVRSDNIVGAVREGCAEAGVALDIVGAGVGAVSTAPENLLGQYDVVFGKGRCALEAMAVGTAVVLCDAFGFAGMVSMANVQTLRPLNFGRRSLVGTPVTAARVAAALRQYNADNATAVARHIRAVAGLDLWLDELIRLYQQLRAHPASAVEQAHLLPFASDVVARALEQFADRSPVRHEIERIQAHAAALAVQLHQLQHSGAVRLWQRVSRLPFLGRSLRFFGRFIRRLAG